MILRRSVSAPQLRSAFALQLRSASTLQLRKCDLAMVRLLRERQHEPGAQRILSQGYLGSWPLRILARGSFFSGLRARFRRPPYPKMSRPKFFLPFLSTQPVWPSTDDASKLLMQNWEAIREEFRAIMADKAVADINTTTLTQQGSWQKVPLWSHGTAHEENLSRCPLTAGVLEQLPLCKALGMSYFSQIGPGTNVKPHFGPTNARLRIHLGLDVPSLDPEQLHLAVGDGGYVWEEGKTLVFDDSYIHAVRAADGLTQARGVLIVDVYHPELTIEERRLLEDLELVHRHFFPAAYQQLPH